MDIDNLKSCISHEEATIRSFMRDPEFAKELLIDAIDSGDFEYAQTTLLRLKEAQRRIQDDETVASAMA